MSGAALTPRAARREAQTARRAFELEQALHAQRTAQALMATGSGPVPSAPAMPAGPVGENESGSEPLPEARAGQTLQASEVPEGTTRVVPDDAATVVSAAARTEPSREPSECGEEQPLEADNQNPWILNENQ